MIINAQASEGFVEYLKRMCIKDEVERVYNENLKLKYREAYDIVSEKHKSSGWKKQALNDAYQQWLEKREPIGVKIEKKEIIETEVKMTKEEKKKLRELIKATEEYLAKLPEELTVGLLCELPFCLYPFRVEIHNKCESLKKLMKNEIIEEHDNEAYERFMNEEDDDNGTG